jgi:hypothetical protein
VDTACQVLRKGVRDKRLTKEQHQIVQKLAYYLADPEAVQSKNVYLVRLLAAFKRAFADVYCVGL